MSSRWQSHIDQILGDARLRAAGQDPSGAKIASGGSVLDAARETADALDYVALQDPTTGGPLGHFLVEKAAAKLKVTPTQTTGVQGEPPRKTSTSASAPTSGSRPSVSAASAGEMPEFPLKQTGGKIATGAGDPKSKGETAWKPLDNSPLEDPTSWSPGSWSPSSAKVASAAEGTTLFDIVMQGRAATKEAMSPEVYAGGEDSGAAPSANEGTLTRFLRDNGAVVSLTKREAKLPTRARIQEIFQHVNDPANGEAAQIAFPNASAKGGLKVAGWEGDKEETGSSGLKRHVKRMLTGAAIGTATGAGLGALGGHRLGNARLGSGVGGLLGMTPGLLAGGTYDAVKRFGPARDKKPSEQEEKKASVPSLTQFLSSR